MCYNMNETTNNERESNDELLPLPQTEAVLASELEDGPHRFRIVGFKIRKNVSSKKFDGTYVQFQPQAKPLDEDIGEKVLGLFYPWNIKTSTACGEFLSDQGVDIEVTDQGVKLHGLVGSCFKADVVHVEKDGVVYANIERDSVQHIECTEQGKLA